MKTTDHIMPISMTETEQEEIIRELTWRGPRCKFTEWGSGGSTVLWYHNLLPGQHLVSIENSRIWADSVQQAVNKVKLLDDTVRFFDYRVYETEDDGATFEPEHSYYEQYVTAGDDCWDSEIYLVDGRVRLWVARTIFQRAIDRSAVVYCHDYAYNAGHWDQLLEIYPRHEIISTPNTPFQMLKLYLQ